MTTSPKYGVGDTVYLRESAALSFLEAVRISKIETRGDQWLYAYQQVSRYQPMGHQAIGAYGDRRSFANGAELLLDEAEIVDYPTALDMAIINMQNRLQHMQNLRAAIS